MNAEARKLDIFSTALQVIAGALNSPQRPQLYNSKGEIIPDSYYSFRRQAAKRTGSMKNWIPQRLFSRSQEALERERIVERAIDLASNDPHAAGVVDTFAATIAGSGLVPISMLDQDTLKLEKDEIRTIQTQQRIVYQTWYPFADVTGRMTFGAIQHLLIRNLVEYGEYIVLLHMFDDPLRPYSLACQIINPLRLKTPIDQYNNPNIKDGVELGEYGEPVAYWIKKSSRLGAKSYLPDTSSNFLRIPIRQAHRWNVIHNFVCKEPEQVRGISFFTPAMKFFRDLNDYLDAELVSNIVTAAFSLFIETQAGQDPFNIAGNLATLTETEQKRGNTTTSYDVRYQEMIPGQIMYGGPGEKPTAISANRPGATFDPFTKIIKKAIAMGLNIPYPVLFKDVEGVNFAGFRSAMLDAWRVFMYYRTWLGQGTNQKIYTMLMEEAWLRGDLIVKDFYVNMHNLTRAEWRGSPKGDIEPIKAVQADVLAIQNNIKTRAEAIAERGGDLRTTFDQLQEEQEMMKARNLAEGPLLDASKVDTGGAVGDMQGAGGEGL